MVQDYGEGTMRLVRGVCCAALRTPSGCNVTRQHDVLDLAGCAVGVFQDEDAMCVYMLYERSLGTDSRFHPYFTTLPDHIPQLPMLDDDVLGRLEDKTLVAKAHGRRRELNQRFVSAKQQLQGIADDVSWFSETGVTVCVGGTRVFTARLLAHPRALKTVGALALSMMVLGEHVGARVAGLALPAPVLTDLLSSEVCSAQRVDDHDGASVSSHSRTQHCRCVLCTLCVSASACVHRRCCA